MFDDVSEGYGSTYLCGNITYTIVDQYYQAAPSFIEAEFLPGEADFSVNVDASNLADDATIDLFLEAKLDNYDKIVQPFYDAF